MDKRREWFMDILSMEYRWPQEDDCLLRRSRNWRNGVQFSHHPTAKHSHQWNGFMKAADGLVQMCKQKGYEHEKPFVIYPILYNYRHGLELALKWVLIQYGTDDYKSVSKPHGLRTLWGKCRKIIDECGDCDSDSTNVVERIIEEFDEIDPGSQAFRYGWDNKGKEIDLPDDKIDIDNIRDVMQGVRNYLDGLDGWLDHLQKPRPEL